MSLETYIYNFLDDIYKNSPKSESHKEFPAAYNCLVGLFNYLNGEFNSALQNFEDARLLLEVSDDVENKILYEFLLGFINYNENSSTYILHYKNAQKYAQKENKEDFLNLLTDKINKIKNGCVYTTTVKKDPLLALVKIGQAVAAEKNIDKLMQTIAEETKEAIQADRCTVFLYDKETDELWSKVALGLGSSELRFKSNQGLAGHVFHTGEPINIKDAYSDERFNKNIDKETGYTTKTILCMPIKNINQEIIGVFQVLNKLTGYFTEEDEDLLITIGSSAGISLENATLFERQNELLKE